ncbi:MAG: ammonium transporter [Acidobacteria bacterium]|nr:ammonium transporter [Acidobacteriota bacterium]
MRRTLWLTPWLLCLLAIPAAAQTAPPALSAGDNAWMLVSAALVLMMTGPGLALFYGGLVRTKNVLGTMMQSFILMALITLLWAVVGYSLAFSEGTPVIGGLQYAFLRGVGLDPNADYGSTVPHQTYMIYQLMFAIITPALISGAFAERMKFSAMALFSVLWSLVVYFPLAHMIWGKGGLMNALYLGKRHGYPHEPMKPHSVVLSFIGACLLWVGWFGFNAGSAIAASSLATSAFVATHFAGATGALGWSLGEWFRNGKCSALGAISGSVAGLATITPASGFVKPMPALLIGFVAGVVCYLMVAVVKGKFGYDDSLDAFGVHGIGGTIGTLSAGVFATNAINNGLKEASGHAQAMGLVDGNPGQILHQLAAVVIGWVLAGAGTWIILKVVDQLVGVRVGRDEEIEGLDLSQHGEEGYNFEG